MRILLAIFIRPTRRRWLVTALAGIFILSALVRARGSQNVVLAWNPSPATNVVGYNVYFGTESGSYPFLINLDNVTDTQIYGLADGATYFFAVSATDSEGDESALSEEISYTVPLPPPVTLAAQVFPEADGQPPYMVITTTDSLIGWWEVDCSTDLQNWGVYRFGYSYSDVLRYGGGLNLRVPLDPAQPQMFFRLLKF